MEKLAPLAAILGLMCGLAIAYGSWDSKIYFYLQGSQRHPTAIKNAFDFSDLRGAALQSAGKNRLLESASILNQQDQMQIELGHFVLRDSQGFKTFACNELDRVELRFYAEGVSHSGEPTEMVIDGLCVAKGDGSKISPLTIPVAKIFSNQVSTKEFQFWDELKTNVKFVNVLDEWPTQWVLREVRLYNSHESEKKLSVSREEIRDILAEPMLLDWTSFRAQR